MRFIKIIAMVLLIIAASVGATLYYSGNHSGFAFLKTNTQNTDETKNTTIASGPTSPLVPIKPIFTTLEPFTVTLSDGRRTRVLHVAITLRVDDNTSHQLINTFMPMVRDRVLKVLATQDPFYVQSSEGREALVAELSTTLRASYPPNHATPTISDVLFTAFVIQ